MYLEIALKYEVKQSKNGKFPSNYKASPIDFETQISLHRLAPPNISPFKRALENCEPQGLFSEFYGICCGYPAMWYMHVIIIAIIVGKRNK